MSANQQLPRPSRRDKEAAIAPEAALPRGTVTRRASSAPPPANAAQRRQVAKAEPVAKEQDATPAKTVTPLRRKVSNVVKPQATRTSATPAPPSREVRHTARRRSQEEESPEQQAKNKLLEAVEQKEREHYENYQKRHELNSPESNILKKVMNKSKLKEKEAKPPKIDTYLHDNHLILEAEFRSWRRQELLKGIRVYITQKDVIPKELMDTLNSEFLENIVDSENSLKEHYFNTLFKMFCRLSEHEESKYLNALLLTTPETAPTLD